MKMRGPEHCPKATHQSTAVPSCLRSAVDPHRCRLSSDTAKIESCVEKSKKR